MLRLPRGEHGQTSAEYLGVILVVAAIIAVVGSARAEISEALSAQVQRAVCVMAGEEDCESARRAAREGPDTDGDGLSDAAARAAGSDPARPDGDRDGLSDRREVELGLNPSVRNTGEEVDRERANEAFTRELVGGRHPPGPRRASAQQNAEFFTAPAPPTGSGSRAHPEIVGRLDGAPPDLRYFANRLLMLRTEPRLNGMIAGVESRARR